MGRRCQRNGDDSRHCVRYRGSQGALQHHQLDRRGNIGDRRRAGGAGDIVRNIGLVGRRVMPVMPRHGMVVMNGMSGMSRVHHPPHAKGRTGDGKGEKYQR